MPSNPSSPTKPSSFRLLILSPSPRDPASIPPLRSFLEAITGSKPSDDIASFAGYTSHSPLRLRTKYYSADVGIWCDELPPTTEATKSSLGKESDHAGCSGGPQRSSEDAVTDSEPVTLAHWKEQMLSSEAKEVRAVIGGIVLVLPIVASLLPSPNAPILEQYVTLVETVHALREAVEDESYGRDIASLVVLQSTTPAVGKAKLSEAMSDLEEVCLSERGILGWDFVAWESGQLLAASEGKHGQTVDQEGEDVGGDGEDERNEFGEKTGIKRVIEALEGVDWSASPHADDEREGDDGHGDFDFADFDQGEDEDVGELFSSSSKNIFGKRAVIPGFDYEFQREMMELKMSMLEDVDDSDDNENHEKVETEREDEDTQVEQLQVLMERVVAIREAGSEMPRTERDKFARREIRRIMREMG
ncbi:uncharacterized protein A1O5_11430 [Cladophialophora psammophila CBS 110553]|uniref:Increased recombination centers protein 6 n=1 Tax=Cladophialophora psammophila CBS 110553 TaxID=1182543 RepID=W9WFP2_9EURO|nr:uncharacterized protein A1O5_11430 [Cladophialophora psammophila CBS 110553]EXJ63381.1 hypothetical protein A1O5_11430 [Cladophialophora psammophila CBS 110553]